MPDQDSVLTFMTAYAEAFHSFEPQRVAPFYDFPLTMANNDGVQVISNPEALAGAVAGVKQLLDARGYARSDPPLFSVRPLDARLVLVGSEWRRLDGAGKAIQHFGTTYLLHAGEAGWKIRSAVLHRPEAMREL